LISPANPANLPLPKDLDYDNALKYRQPKPVISSSKTSNDEDKRKSSKTTPINIQTPPNPNDLPLFAFLEDKLIMAVIDAIPFLARSGLYY
jgi:hypothetical protein